MNIPKNSKDPELSQCSHSEFLAAIAECVQDGILVLDASGKVLYSNSASKRIFNVESEEFPDLDLGIPLTLNGTAELDIKVGENELRTVELRALQPYAGSESMFVIGVREVTYERQLERQLSEIENQLQLKFKKEVDQQVAAFEEERKKLYFRLNENRFREKRFQDRIWLLEEEAESLLHEKQELEMFGHIAGHDLKDSLRSLMLATDFLIQHPSCKTNTELLSYREMIRRHSTHLIELLRDIQTFTRIQNLEEEWSDFSMADACEKAVEVLKDKLQERKAIVRIGNLPWVRANFNLLVLVLRNLISNASKFQKNRLPEIEISSDYNRTTGEIFICVQDNGIGIDQKYFDRLFQIFSRLVRREEYAGSGLGLAICRKIVESHKGRIWVESELEVGTRIYFSLPGFYSPRLSRPLPSDVSTEIS